MSFWKIPRYPGKTQKGFRNKMSLSISFPIEIVEFGRKENKTKNAPTADYVDGPWTLSCPYQRAAPNARRKQASGEMLQDLDFKAIQERNWQKIQKDSWWWGWGCPGLRDQCPFQPNHTQSCRWKTWHKGTWVPLGQRKATLHAKERRAQINGSRWAPGSGKTQRCAQQPGKVCQHEGNRRFLRSWVAAAQVKTYTDCGLPEDHFKHTERKQQTSTKINKAQDNRSRGKGSIRNDPPERKRQEPASTFCEGVHAP